MTRGAGEGRLFEGGYCVKYFCQRGGDYLREAISREMVIIRRNTLFQASSNYFLQLPPLIFKTEDEEEGGLGEEESVISWMDRAGEGERGKKISILPCPFPCALCTITMSNSNGSTLPLKTVPVPLFHGRTSHRLINHPLTSNPSLPVLL